MNTAHELGVAVFRSILQTSGQAAVLTLLILLVLWLVGKRLSPGWRYGLWTLVIVRLMLPVSPPAAWSLFNVAALPKTKPSPIATSQPITVPI